MTLDPDSIIFTYTYLTIKSTVFKIFLKKILPLYKVSFFTRKKLISLITFIVKSE
jgi:hypothetical protein